MDEKEGVRFECKISIRCEGSAWRTIIASGVGTNAREALEAACVDTCGAIAKIEAESSPQEETT